MAANDELSRVFSALADPTRREILTLLSRGSASVGEVAAPFSISAPAISQHLRVLENAGLIHRTTDAQRRKLTLTPEPLNEVTTWVQDQRQQWNLRLDALERHIETMKNTQQTTPAKEKD